MKSKGLMHNQVDWGGAAEIMLKTLSAEGSILDIGDDDVIADVESLSEILPELFQAEAIEDMLISKFGIGVLWGILIAKQSEIIEVEMGEPLDDEGFDEDLY